MVQVLTAGQRTGEFLVSEANGTLSREAAMLKAGNSVEDGQVLKFDNAGLLVPTTGSFDTEGVSDEDVAGIAYGAHTASDIAPLEIPYIARLAEVKEERIKLHGLAPNHADYDEANAAVLGALESLNIVAR